VSTPLRWKRAILRGLLRKARTVESAKQFLEEYLALADPRDIRGGGLRWLMWCKSKGNPQHTLEAKRLRVAAFYKRRCEWKIPRVRYVEKRAETYTQEELDRLRPCSCVGRFKIKSGRFRYLSSARCSRASALR